MEAGDEETIEFPRDIYSVPDFDGLVPVTHLLSIAIFTSLNSLKRIHSTPSIVPAWLLYPHLAL